MYTQLCSALCDLVDCSPPGSSVHPNKNDRVGWHFPLRGIFPTQGLNTSLLHLLHWRAVPLLLMLLEKLTIKCLWCSVIQFCPTLWNPMDCSPPGSSVHGISQVKILEGVVIPLFRNFPNLGIKPTSLMSLALAGRCCFLFFSFLTNRATWEALCQLR